MTQDQPTTIDPDPDPTDPGPDPVSTDPAPPAGEDPYPPPQDLWAVALDAMRAASHTRLDLELHRQVSDVMDQHRRGRCGQCRVDDSCEAAEGAHRVVLAWLVDRVEA